MLLFASTSWVTNCLNTDCRLFGGKSFLINCRSPPPPPPPQKKKKKNHMLREKFNSAHLPQKAFKILFQSDLPLYRCIKWKNLVYNFAVTKLLFFKRSVQWKQMCELFPIIHPHMSKAIAHEIGMRVLIFPLIEAFDMLFRHNDVMPRRKHKSSALLTISRRIHWLLANFINKRALLGVST